MSSCLLDEYLGVVGLLRHRADGGWTYKELTNLSQVVAAWSLLFLCL